MFIVIPLRILTALIGLMLGYTAGTYWEILYEKKHDYRAEVAALLAGMKQGASLNEGDTASDDEGDIATFFFDSHTTDTDADTSESEGE